MTRGLTVPIRFAIAVSFPGEHRRLVRSVVEHLSKQLGRDRVFYDEWYEAELVGPNGDLKLKRYYREQCEMVVPFFSKHYAKPWCRIEWDAIRTILLERRDEDAVVPVELDRTRIDGWESVDFAIRRGSRTGTQIAEKILAAYWHRHPQSSGASSTRGAQTSILPNNIEHKSEPKSGKFDQSREARSASLAKTSRSRFLDALDSSRFAPRTTDVFHLLRIVYVKAQFFLSLVSGDSIVVSENQLFDSMAFLETFNELHSAAQGTHLAAHLPIRVALRPQYDDVFQLVSKRIQNEQFVLTLWPLLDGDAERRRQWADLIRCKRRPSPRVVSNDDEQKLLDKLWTVLEYFTPDRCVPAHDIPMQFAEMVKRIAALSDDEIDAMHTGKCMNRSVRKYLNTDAETKSAKEIRDVLRKTQETRGELPSRSLIRYELERCKDIRLRDGVIELTDCIYNQTLGLATGAALVQTSTFPDRINDKYITAGYSLATYIQDTHHFRVPWAMFAYDAFENLEGCDHPRLRREYTLFLEAIRQNVPWPQLADMQCKPAWRDGAEKIRSILDRAQTIDRRLCEDPLTKEERHKLESGREQIELQGAWENHVRNVRGMVSNNYWTITPSKVLFSHPDVQFAMSISYSLLKTKRERDMEDEIGYKFWRSCPSFKGRMDEWIC